MGERKNLVYPIPGPDGDTILPKRQWLWGKDRMLEALENGEIEFLKGRDGKFSVHSKQYLKDSSGSLRQGKPFSIIDDVFTQHGTNEIIQLLGSAQIFSFPKPSAFVRKLIDIATTGDGEEIIMDFFSGSASTAHAVISANAFDRGKRRFIMVQLPESCDEKSEAFKAGYKTISKIGMERIRRAGRTLLDNLGAKGDKALGAESEFGTDLFSESEGCAEEKVYDSVYRLDVGFRVLKVDSSTMNDVYYDPDGFEQGQLFAENIKLDRTSEDLLFQVLLDWGVDLSLPIVREKISGNEVYFVDGNALAACFVSDGKVTEDFVKLLAERQPLRVVFRDAGFKDDSVKINVEQIFKLKSPHTDIKTI